MLKLTFYLEIIVKYYTKVLYINNIISILFRMGWGYPPVERNGGNIFFI
jgi:hypothetical protein